MGSSFRPLDLIQHCHQCDSPWSKHLKLVRTSSSLFARVMDYT
uniref:Uncharacterized protein n=1 Tax=Populus trichocarpa TaxID=3694 RepID=A0A3N7GX24_POPTR